MPSGYKFVNLPKEEVDQLIEIPEYRTRNLVYKFLDFYYNPINKRFLRYIRYYDCYIEKNPNRNQLVCVMTVDRKICRMAYSEIEKQYPQITGLFDPTRPTRTKKGATKIEEEKNETEEVEETKNENGFAATLNDFSDMSVTDLLDSSFSSIL